MTRTAPVLDRDDPAKPPLSGATKVTREDWLRLARDILVHDGEGEVKVLAMGNRLGVSRSSFYWYFKDKQDLLKALLEDWDGRNTQVIRRHCEMPAASITGAVCNFFHCFVDPDLFDPGLDFAVREWSRRDPDVRTRIDEADARRLTAITAMFERHGYDAADADIRARILYFMQLGYHALDLREPADARLARIEGYLRGFTGTEPNGTEIDTFLNFARERLV
ncbi:MAG: TetR/AcrR family transcriptional regulator [Pseudomonadota bacterium]